MNDTHAIPTVAIVGGGNIGSAIARGMARYGSVPRDRIVLTRRKIGLLADLGEEGFGIQSDNGSAIRRSDVIILAVGPAHTPSILEEVATALDPARHTLISIVSGITIREIRRFLGQDLSIVRAMPNTAIAIGESMTCLAAEPGREGALTLGRRIFDMLGRTLVVDEEQIVPATALCACGIAFFLRAIRAASQGGIEIGFHASEALFMAAQTARGASALLLSEESHPESEIDKVTTPRGCTIVGLNQMEHEGFSSALIRGIVTSADKAARLYTGKGA
jgi:pyrroline-5-carboxylate reductase